MNIVKAQGKNSWFNIFMTCWTVYAVSYLARMNLSIAIPAIEAEGIATLGELGMAGTLYFWFYGFGHLLNGFLGDRFPAKYMIFLGLFFSALINLGVSSGPSPLVIIVLWSLNGFCLSMLWGPIVRLLGEYMPVSRYSTISLLMTVSIGAGTFVSWNLLGKGVEHFGRWQIAFYVPALACGIFSLVWLKYCPSSPPKKEEHRQDDRPVRKVSFSIILRETRLYLIILAAMVQGMIKDGLTLWLPSLIQARYPQEPVDNIINWISLIPLLNTAGLLLAAFITKKKPIEYRSTVIFLFLCSAATLFLLCNLTASILVTMILLSLLSFFIIFINSILLGMVPLLYNSRDCVSTVAGLLDFIAYFAAGIFSTYSGLLFRESNSWNGIFRFLLIGVLAGALIMIPAKKRIS